MKIFDRLTIFFMCVLSLGIFIFVTSCGASSSSGGSVDPTFTLSSTDISNNGVIGETYVYTNCNGNNQSPQLSWSNLPENAQSLALTVMDSSASNFIHWIVYNIPTTTTSLDRGVTIAAPIVETDNDYGQSGYGGPCPPTGETHTYQFKIWTLDIADLTQAQGFDASSNAAIQTAIINNSAHTATINATYTSQ